MAELTICCPLCKKQQVVKYGFSFKGKQRYICRNNLCQKNTFIHIKLQDTGFLFMKATVFVVYFQISIQYLEVICVYIKL